MYGPIYLRALESDLAGGVSTRLWDHDGRQGTGLRRLSAFIRAKPTSSDGLETNLVCTIRVGESIGITYDTLTTLRE